MSLTGGTRDVNPQWLTFRASQSGADTAATTQQNIPIQRLPSSGRAQVLEILKVWFSNAAAHAEVDSSYSAFLSTRNMTTTVDSNDTGVFAYFKRATLLTTSGLLEVQDPVCLDLTDNAGHGIIIATDAIFCRVQSVTTSATNLIDVKILYRWKNVSLAEYIGIVQSQQ